MFNLTSHKESINYAIRILLLKVLLWSFLFVYILMILQEVYESVQAEQEQIQMLSDVIATNVKASLLFKDSDSAQQTMNALVSSSSVKYAILKDVNNSVIASYGNATPKGVGYLKNIEKTKMVMLNGEEIGELFIISGLTRMWNSILGKLGTMALVMLCTIFIAAIIIRRLASTITLPINNLVKTSREISLTGKYELRTKKITNNEVGELADTFNEMLDLVEKRDDELRLAAITFNTQEAIIITDSNKNVIKINPAYTQITGYQLSDVENHEYSFFNSNYHDADFYQKIDVSLVKQGYWAGEITDKHSDGRLYPGNYMITAVTNDADAITHYVVTFTDISERIAAEEKIRDLAFYDPLTHLPNRRLLMDCLSSALKSSIRTKQFGALVFLDLDKFKLLNDSKGHGYGDLLLTEVAKRLLRTVRDEDLVSRLGGDEFVVMLEELGTDLTIATDYAHTVGNKLVMELNQTYVLENYSHNSSASVGIALFRGDESDVESVFLQADTAMYSAKKLGRNTLCIFDASMQEIIEKKVQNEKELHQAIALKEFELHYQIIVDSKGNSIGAEALLRWNHPTKGMLLPDDFIPLAEELGVIKHIGDWTLHAACQQLKLWQEIDYAEDLVLTINISALEFQQQDFVDGLLAVVSSYKINSEKLKIELTETVILHDIDFAIEQITQLKIAGVMVAMDDFGTGYSSLNYLSQLPISFVKIDHSFIARMTDSVQDTSIITMIISLGKMLNMTIIAEGIEKQQQYDALKVMGCDSYQGHFFSMPIGIRDFENLVKSKYSL